MNTQSNEKETFAFKTNINCNGCVAKVTPILDTTDGIETWTVDTTNKDKILSVTPMEFPKVKLWIWFKKLDLKLKLWIKQHSFYYQKNELVFGSLD